MLGGITPRLAPPAPVLREPSELLVRGRDPIPPNIGPKLEVGRAPPIVEALGFGRNASAAPVPVPTPTGPDMSPEDIPPNGTTIEPPPIPDPVEVEVEDAAP